MEIEKLTLEELSEILAGLTAIKSENLDKIMYKISKFSDKFKN